ncbi:MAG: hypothetical protein ACR2OR_04550 [Hyphomicrobiales bacterium]
MHHNERYYVYEDGDDNALHIVIPDDIVIGSARQDQLVEAVREAFCVEFPDRNGKTIPIKVGYMREIPPTEGVEHHSDLAKVTEDFIKSGL